MSIPYNPDDQEPRSYSNNGQLNYLLTSDKKVVAFVGATKNGCSFVINNLAAMFSGMGVKTAILDMTESKNAYYIYTDNKEELRQVAYTSIENLEKGINEGIKVNSNLSVFTALPGKKDSSYDAQKILTTLAKNYSLVLIDTDFKTELEYFSLATEIYLVQSMDILTIQPFTSFLRELKTKGILKDDIKIVINKYVKCKDLSVKKIVGGLSLYNDPAMTFMTELFNRDAAQTYVIPYESENYAKYIECLVTCKVTLSGYTKEFIRSLKDLGNVVYPLLTSSDKKSGKKQEFNAPQQTTQFSPNMNNTLEQMRKKY